VIGCFLDMEVMRLKIGLSS